MYNYTRPRKDIMATYNSPGPAVYSLPDMTGNKHHDPRSNHHKGPAWIFGIRHRGNNKKESSPGPVHYPDPKTTRDGPDGGPHYSLYGRPQDLVGFNNPGPGAYSPEKATYSVSPRAVAHKFGARTSIRAKDVGPAPNRYLLPSLLGRSVEGDKISPPKISLKGRSKIGGFGEDLQKTPGPGAYGTTDPRVVKHRPAMYSMRPKCAMPGDTSNIPGPGAHSPEKVTYHKSRAPAFSFGIQHSSFTAPLIVEAPEN